MRNETVILVHGIRDHAYWQSAVRKCLEEAGYNVELTNYGRFDLVKFLLPIPYFRDRVIEKLRNQLQQVQPRPSDQAPSIIAHSFGTFAIAEIMRRKFNFHARRVIFCGSVVRYDFPFEQVSDRFEGPLLNEVGTRDVWPAIAESATWGYGSAGSYGFRRPHVRDRWHERADHGYFLNSEFCQRFWIPFLSEGRIVPADETPDEPSLWVRLLSILKVKYLALIAIAGLLVWAQPWIIDRHDLVEEWVDAIGPRLEQEAIDASRPLPNELQQLRAQFEA